MNDWHFMSVTASEFFVGDTNMFKICQRSNIAMNSASYRQAKYARDLSSILHKTTLHDAMTKIFVFMGHDDLRYQISADDYADLIKRGLIVIRNKSMAQIFLIPPPQRQFRADLRAEYMAKLNHLSQEFQNCFHIGEMNLGNQSFDNRLKGHLNDGVREDGELSDAGCKNLEMILKTYCGMQHLTFHGRYKIILYSLRKINVIFYKF